MLEINCETDFVAREQEFVKFAAEVAREALAAKLGDVRPECAQLPMARPSMYGAGR